ncbi:TRAP transporter small permease [Bacillus sp. M6-12]|uniref:TRAP transporter small permease n=1 Tax=Bacillus sp. M6-12 TaxID=2054166 RepID=UPI0015E07252|nr:TRAP transporter small permease [Bacillus sp. M6-12]
MSTGNVPLSERKTNVKDEWIKSFIHITDSILSKIEMALMIVASVLVVISLMSICYGVLARNFLDVNVSWTIELSEYTMLYLAFLAAPWILKNDDHIKVDVFTQHLSGKTEKWLNGIIYLVGSATCMILFWFSLQVTIDHYQRGIIITNVLEMPKYIPLLIIPIGFGLLFLRFIHNFVRLTLLRES